MIIGRLGKYLLSRLSMLDLSLKDCSLDNRNIFVKTYERECFYDLYPGSSPSDPNISVFTRNQSGIDHSTERSILSAG